ncbi:hypothetical protein TSUD_294690 [Trifolium subterraneum]|uniref:Histone deacetylation protein Rxt3 n=1 Tax=Trifolium subterraneum TaxID=3900 RepID=A0A2Z6M828_TRISU|nr:hypothetical protein TSUD_294690 [Trifolium subterraneum]
MDHHVPHEIGQDSRAAKTIRVEGRDSDRRSPLHSAYRMPLSSTDSQVGHPVGTENRIESRDVKENRDIRSEKDVRLESRGNDSNKGTFGLVSSNPLNWKDSREYRGKRYADSPGGSLDSRHMSRGNTPADVGRENPVAERRDCSGAHEAVGENKVDSKSEDRFKDRKRSDVTHRDWGDKEKERSDCRNSTQVSNSIGEIKESAKEDGDAQKLERERKDIPKNKENSNEREKDHIKRDSRNGVEKDVSYNEKEHGDGSVKVPAHETVLLEQKKHKDADSWKTADGEARDRRKERDTDLEGGRTDKRFKLDKQSEDGLPDGEGTGEKESEDHSCNVQHRKRMQRSRASPLVTTNLEARFGPHAQDNEESQGKAEVSYVTYKVGESMEELIKLWKEYESSHSQVEKNTESTNDGPTLEIRIPAVNVTAANHQVRGGQLWGTDVYTYDSDLVAVLMHTGYCRPTTSPPPTAIQELRTCIRVLPPQDSYISTLRNNVRSRAWGAAIGCSYRVERCCIVKKGGGTIDLEPCLTHTSTIEPSLAPMAVERTITTRAAASNTSRKQRFIREVTIQYNLCNEPWIKYSISIVADKGLKRPLYTSARLKKGEVLYLETHSCRYELCFAGEKIVKAIPATQLHDPDKEKSQNHHLHSANGDKSDSDTILIDVFRWSRCKKPLPQTLMRTVGIPLPLEHVEVIEENIDWEDVQWSQTGVWIAGKEYPLCRVHFLSKN